MKLLVLKKQVFFVSIKWLLSVNQIFPIVSLNRGKIQNCQLICRDIEWTFKQVNETWCWQQGKVRLENLPIPQIPLANAATALAVVQQLRLYI